MARITRKLVVVVLILVGAGIATAATSPVIMGPSAGISSSSIPADPGFAIHVHDAEHVGRCHDDHDGQHHDGDRLW